MSIKLKDTANITATSASSATSATKLQTARTINGTNFDGTGNITTANWGATRNIQIGNTSKSVNGSANVNWSLSEIGAAAASHTHNYAASNHTHTSLEGIDLNGVTASLNNYNLSSGSPKIVCYFCPTDGGGANITGRPNDSTKQAFNLIVESLRYASSTDYITKQTYTQGSQKIMYVRYCTNGTWSAWEKVYTSAQKPTPSDIGAAASNHTHSYVPLANGGNITIHADSDSSSTGEYALIKAGHNELKIASSAGGTTVTKGQDKLTFNGNIVYHAGRKPTVSEIGAAASNHTHNYLPLSGGTLTGSLKISGNNKDLVIGAGTSDVYINNTASGKYIQMKDDGLLSYSGNKIYHAGDKPTASEVGALATSGGTLTGSIKFSGGGYNNHAIRMEAGDANGAFIGIGAGGLTVIGSGESTNAVRTALTNGADETMIVASDQTIRFLTGVQNGYSSAKEVSINAAGVINAPQGMTGNASTATKLQTVRSINGTNFDGTANITTANWGTARNLNGVSVNGSTNYTIPVENYYCNVGNDNTNLYHRILTTDIATANFVDKSLIIVMHSGYQGGGFGIAKITLRTNDISSAANSQGEIKWLVRNGFAANALVFNFVNQAKNACMDVFYKSPGTYAGMTWYVLSEGGRGGAHSKQWTKYNTNASGTNAYTEANMKTLRTYTSTLVSATDAGHVSTANSANTLTTARTINGTSFNGSGNITTANWGTARNLQIGNTAKSVNGSANVTWSLSEIGALALTGGTMTGTITSSKSTGTHLEGNRGTGAIINSTAAGSAYNMLVKMNSTNGAWTMGGWNNTFNLFYTTNSTITAGNNTYTKRLILLDENGNSSFPGTITGSLSGNASTATKLQTARSINGTNFDGTGNITTANWGTARNIQIGNTSKSVNGSGNVSWSLSEIGAASSSHTHSNLRSTDPVRPTSANVGVVGDRSLSMMLATSNMTTAKPVGDGYILNFNWDNTGGYTSQLYVQNSSNPKIQVRGMSGGTWGNWNTVYATNNKPTLSEIGAAPASSVGTLSSLKTSAKGNLVDAINEVFQSADSARSSLVSAIGSPLTSTDTLASIATKLQSKKQELGTAAAKVVDGVSSSTNLNTIVSTLNGYKPYVGRAHTLYVDFNGGKTIYIKPQKTNGSTTMKQGSAWMAMIKDVGAKRDYCLCTNSSYGFPSKTKDANNAVTFSIDSSGDVSISCSTYTSKTYKIVLSSINATYSEIDETESSSYYYVVKTLEEKDEEEGRKDEESNC